MKKTMGMLGETMEYKKKPEYFSVGGAGTKVGA